MPAMLRRSARGSASCVSITAPAIASTFRSGGIRSSSCCVVATKAPKPRTLKLRSVWLRHGANDMGEKLTTYDPAEDLGSDEAIAVFMEEAFKTEDAGYIAH